MEWLLDFFKELFAGGFTTGLCIGLALVFFTWKSSLAAKLQVKKENKRIQSEMRDLEQHLNTQLKINASGNEAVQKQLEDLKVQNETLRVNLSALQNKPGMECAVRVLREQAPGFASAWEQALRQAETEYDETNGGLRKLVRKVIALPNPGEPRETSDSPAN